MLRTIIIKKNTDIQAIRSQLLDARFTGPQGDAAVDQLKALNPHVDLDKVDSDTVLFVPDAPAFKASATTSTPSGPVDDFRSFVADAVSATLQRQKAARAVHAADRASVASALKSDVLKRAAAADPAVATKVDAASKTLAQDDKDDKLAEETLASMGKAALAVLADVKKLLG
jgi:hypothetical protein